MQTNKKKIVQNQVERILYNIYDNIVYITQFDL